MDIPIESVLSVLTYECSEYDDGHLEWWIQLPSQPVFVTDTEEELRQMVRTYLETLTPKPKLTPIVSTPATPQPDVSQESQNDDGWEIYEPVKGDDPNSEVRYSDGTEWAHRHSPSLWYQDGLCREYAYNQSYIYRRPKKQVGQRIIERLTSNVEQGEHKHLDIYLPEIERKVTLASKANPALLDWWRGEKEALAIEAGKRIGGGM
jgi:hypothetical protein